MPVQALSAIVFQGCSFSRAAGRGPAAPGGPAHDGGPGRASRRVVVETAGNAIIQDIRAINK